MKRALALLLFLLPASSSASSLISKHSFTAAAAGGGGGGTIAQLGSTATVSAVSNTTSLSVSHTLSAGSNRIAFVGLALYQGSGFTPGASGVTYGGNAMVFLASATKSTGSDRQVIHVWYIKEANLPSNGSVTVEATIVTNGNTTEKAMGVATYENVDQTTVWRSTHTTTGASTTPSLSVTSVSGDLVIDAISWYEGTRAVGAGQTLVFLAVDPSGTTTDCYSSKEAATGVSTTMSYSNSLSGDFAYFAGSLVQAP